MTDKIIKKDEINLVFAAEAGQGSDTISTILAKVFKDAGYNIFSTKEAMSRIRGGANSNDLRVSSSKICAGVWNIDVLIPLSANALDHVKDRISDNTLIFGEKEFISTRYCQKCKVRAVNFSGIAKEIGGIIYTNTVAAGFIMGLMNLDTIYLEELLKKRFAKKSEDIVNKNIEAAKRGYEKGKEFCKNENISIEIKRDETIKDQIIINGSTAVGMGCIAGGCNYVSSYPMSPSTGVLIFLAANGKEFDIIVEQAEDEIAAINMTLGAWYAGARGLATTSGGGYALMKEGISLAGMIETPVVIHLAQRPGPATGLPTRTEQGDLELALYAGHGEFPRVLYAPGDLQQAFYLSQKAFNIADKYQVPVTILTDQYILDSSYNVEEFDMSELSVDKYIIETNENYKRYEYTENGITPRGIPGFGKGLVGLDSDEHDEEGHITENLNTRVKMVDKRLKKYEALNDDIIPPELIGPENYKTLLLAWGTNLNIVKEAMQKLNKDDLAFLHYSQVWPLHPDTIKYLEKAEKVIMIENNATSQFAKLIRQQTGFTIQDKILKYNGHAFYVEELVEKISDLI
jgi:2-oxoglutarate ferredoxin oxidoreductase subunit alpha